MSSRRPLVVLWDADGVLQRAAPGWRERLLERGGESFLDDLFTAEQPCLTGDRPFVDAVTEVIARRGMDLTARNVMVSWTLIDVDQQALRLLEEVRAGGVQCVLATNQHDLRRDVMRAEPAYADHLDGAYYSCEIGAAKPDTAYFTAILDDLRVGAAEALLIDDSARNVHGARQAGLRAELHDPRTGVDGLRTLLGRHGVP